MRVISVISQFNINETKKSVYMYRSVVSVYYTKLREFKTLLNKIFVYVSELETTYSINRLRPMDVLYIIHNFRLEDIDDYAYEADLLIYGRVDLLIYGRVPVIYKVSPVRFHITKPSEMIARRYNGVYYLEN
jgi:hypothetical protein